MNISNTFLAYKYDDGTIQLVPISSILDGGVPIHPETEDDLPLASINLYNEKGELIHSK